jgi:putative hydrolase
MANPFVKVIAHPANPMFPVKVEETVSEAKKRGILLEINNSDPFSRPGAHERALEFAREIKRQDWRVVVGTDSHISLMLGVFGKALELIKQADLNERHIVNTSMAKIETYLKIG